MKRLIAFAISILFLVACATAPTPEPAKTDGAFFDANVVDTFLPGKTTQQDIRTALGEPYPDPLKSSERWTYMYTYQKQIIFTFDDGILTGKQWSTEHGIGIGAE
ncbi:MAG TPA: outer membrane protein assembly factor BamE [Deferrisomatales bacterium]|nr:outer membrane protein assembly factor BamE [Deferrisomatales bacterium]